MNAAVTRISLLGLILSVTGGHSRDDPTDTPAEQFETLMKEYRPASNWLRGAKTDRGRRVGLERFGAFSEKFLDLADRHPGDPTSLSALRQAIQIVNSTDSGALTCRELSGSEFPVGSDPSDISRAISLLLRDYSESAALGPVIDRVRYGYRLEYEGFLRTLLRDNPHREIQALSSLALALYLNDRLAMLQLVADRPEMAERWEAIFGMDYLPKLRERGAIELARQAETLFEKATEYDDVKTAAGATVAEPAKSGLYELRHLAIGKTAPDIEGRDQDGRPFKLSDYREKVVLLYFWSEY